MARFAGAPVPALRLDTVLHDDFDALRAARGEDDTRMITFVDGLDEAALGGSFSYRATSGERYVAQLAPALDHMFNHQTHHRGQCHAVLTGFGTEVPGLDLMRFYGEVGHGGLIRLS